MAGMVNPSETYTAWSIGEGAHEVTGLKPMLNPEEQVALLKAKGVSFERCGEEQAADALARRGTFVHLASCRRLFQKHASGDDRGKCSLTDLRYSSTSTRKAFLASRKTRGAGLHGDARLLDDGYGIVADFAWRNSTGYIERTPAMSAGIDGGDAQAHHRPLEDAMPA
ncbi:MAG: hypothetical protein ACLU0V_05310 [Eggerthella lenta]